MSLNRYTKILRKIIGDGKFFSLVNDPNVCLFTSKKTSRLKIVTEFEAEYS